VSGICHQRRPRAGVLACQLARRGEHTEGLLAQQAYKQLFSFVRDYCLWRARPHLLGLPRDAGRQRSSIAQSLAGAAALTTEQCEGRASHA
jgi:hypothetical protein